MSEVVIDELCSWIVCIKGFFCFFVFGDCWASNSATQALYRARQALCRSAVIPALKGSWVLFPCVFWSVGAAPVCVTATAASRTVPDTVKVCSSCWISSSFLCEADTENQHPDLLSWNIWRGQFFAFQRGCVFQYHRIYQAFLHMAYSS